MTARRDDGGTVDVTPGAHQHTQALATTSFTLACGCRRNHHRELAPSLAIELKQAGCEYPCPRHGPQVITRSTMRLVGWDDDGLGMFGRA